MNAVKLEFWFLTRDKPAMFWLTLAFVCATTAIFFGLQEVSSQREIIERLKLADAKEREISIQEHRDWGSAAYYTFHLTYDAPSNFAFAALGQRDVQPWKHRVRMLALEGQIYEADAQNPDFALIGRFDFAFLVSVLLPLFVIFLIYDLRAREHASGRFELLDATNRNVWRVRVILRLSLLCLMLLVPLWVTSINQDVTLYTIGIASIVVVFYVLFWWVITAWISTRQNSSTFNLTALIGVWFAFTIAIPTALKVGIDYSIKIPDDGDLLLTQREAVNDAWDLPKEDTYKPFLEQHPQFADYTAMENSFEWKWYYAFQQVGDQVVKPISKAYHEGRVSRDKLAATLSWLAPPAKVERVFQSIANTDADTYFTYENRIRRFHKDLRYFYYPKLFRDEDFTEESLADRPNYPTTFKND